MPKTTEEQLTEHLDEVNKVANLYLQGQTQNEIATQLGIPRVRVISLINDWRDMAANNEAIHARAREALMGADSHFNSLIRRAYEVVEEADQNGELKEKTAALKLIGDFETKRMDMLHRAGLLDNQEIAAELARMEEKHEIVITVLKEIARKHPEIRMEIMERLNQITNGVAIDA